MKKLKFTEIVLILLNIVYPIVFALLIVPVFTESVYLAVVSIIMLIGFPLVGFFWFKSLFKEE